MILKLAVLLASLLVLFSYSKTSLFAITSWQKNENNPVLKNGPVGSWDQNLVGSPSILYINNNFKMWYEGHDGNNWRIGYASSQNGVAWNKNNQYVVDRLDSLNDKNAHDPKVIFENQKYLMWYASSDNTINNIHVNFSSSTDEIHWSNPLLNILTPQLIWEIPKGISYPYVLFVNDKYVMWYGAHGNKNGRFAWRIGYATSDDGINWVKHPEPVLVADQAWEGSDVGNPSVLLEDGIYHMWYHADRDIGHAVSFDGINWVKDPGNPVLKPGPFTWDLFRVMNPSVLKKDNIYYMFYTGAAFDGKWQIGLATSDEIFKPSISPSPSPTSSPSSTPTPSIPAMITPTITITLTPTPLLPSATPLPSPIAVTEPIIFIPGLGASWNPYAIFSCQLPSSSVGTWKLASYAFVYQRFIKTLTKNAHLSLGKNFYVYAYDWRQPLDIQAEQFKKYIDQLLLSHPPQTKVKVVGHSLGGLVVRSYISKYSNTHRISTVITVGTPHEGTVLAYPVWEGGEIWENNLLIQLALTQILTHCRIKRTLDTSRNRIFPPKVLDNKRVVHDLIPSIESLLPTFDFLRKNGTPVLTDSLHYQNIWIKAHPFTTDFFHTSFITVSGNDKETLRYLDIEETPDSEKKLGDWIDGKPISKSFVQEGDGTILQISSLLPNAINEKISGDHIDIISSTEGITKILQYLGLSSVKPAEFEYKSETTSKTALMLSIDYDAQLDITDPYRKVTSAQNNIISLFNPLYGIYKIRIKNLGSANKLYISLAQENKTSIDLTTDILPFQRKSYQLIYSRISSSPLQLITLP